MNITYWLRKTPQPVAILADDKRIEIPKNGRSWRDLTATIGSLEPTKLTALDGSGNVIRSVVLESDEEKTPPSPEMSDVQLFAKLISEAYDKASSKMQPIVDSAMAFVERGGQRLAKAEAENDRLRSQIHKLNMQIAELTGAASPAGDESSLMGSLIAGALQAGGANAANPLAGAVSAIKGGKK